MIVNPNALFYIMLLDIELRAQSHGKGVVGEGKPLLQKLIDYLQFHGFFAGEGELILP